MVVREVINWMRDIDDECLDLPQTASNASVSILLYKGGVPIFRDGGFLAIDIIVR